MLTIKLRNELTKRVSIVECERVDVEYGNELAILKAHTNGSFELFTISPFAIKDVGLVRPEDHHVAFVENAHGATTQVVRL